MKNLRNRHLFMIDVVLLILAAYAAYVLRLEEFDLGKYWTGFFVFTGIAVVVLPLVFRRAGIYSRYWFYASVEEVTLLAGSVLIGSLLAGILVLLATRAWPVGFVVPRSIPLLFSILALAATASPRFILRIWARRKGLRRARLIKNGAPAQPVLVVGAGDAGAMIVRELVSNPQIGMKPAGFIDDDPGKQRLHIHGLQVLGDRAAIPAVAAELKVRQVIIAMPTAPGTVIRDVKRICDEAGIATRIVPGVYELLDGTVKADQLREVRIEDLLRREPVVTDIAQVKALLQGRRVLVTGAGGSIGRELCRQVLACGPAEIVLLGHGENSIFEIHSELEAYNRIHRASAGGAKTLLSSVIADIRSPERLGAVFEAHRPEIVFHAAAHKHVPLMECNPSEAVSNNVLGTRNVLEASLKAGVERFVFISTDKAVNPASIMGASKRAAELLVSRAAQRSVKPYVVVRFGNVLGSRGSVVPYFQRQIADGGPVTITHPDVSRYFMTIPEAVQLVLQAATLGDGGHVFALEMGVPIRILDLAKDLIRLSGREMGRDIEIEIIGLRPGEKMQEETCAAGEQYAPTIHAGILVARNGIEEDPSLDTIDEALAALAACAARDDRRAIVEALQRMVPEFAPPPVPGGDQR